MLKGEHYAGTTHTDSPLDLKHQVWDVSETPMSCAAWVGQSQGGVTHNITPISWYSFTCSNSLGWVDLPGAQTHDVQIMRSEHSCEFRCSNQLGHRLSTWRAILALFFSVNYQDKPIFKTWDKYSWYNWRSFYCLHDMSISDIMQHFGQDYSCHIPCSHCYLNLFYRWSWLKKPQRFF